MDRFPKRVIFVIDCALNLRRRWTLPAEDVRGGGTPPSGDDVPMVEEILCVTVLLLTPSDRTSCGLYRGQTSQEGGSICRGRPCVAWKVAKAPGDANLASIVHHFQFCPYFGR